MTRGRAVGVYVHIPFCADRCDYCDFATWTDRGHLIGDYVDACVTDVAPEDGSRGSPGDERLLRRRHALAAPGRRPGPDPAARSPRAGGAEVTVECNPDSVDARPARDVPRRAA